MAQPVAPGNSNVLRGTKLRMCAMRFKVPLPDKKGSDGQSLSYDLLQCFTLEVLKEGYVILIMTANAEASLPPDPKYVFAARTTSKGELMAIEPSEFDGGVPSNPDKAMYFPYGATYACFWTKDKSLFKDVWQLAQADPVKATVTNPFSNFIVARGRSLKGPPPPFRVHDTFGLRLNLLLYDRDGEDGELAVHGVYFGGYCQSLGANDAEMMASYVIARSDAMAALYVGALVQRQAIERREKSAGDWAVFEGVRDIVLHAQRKLRVKQLDDSLAVLPGTTYRAGNWNEKFLEYAYACARARVPRKLFWDAISVLVTDDGWKRAAAEIWQKYQLVHPGVDEHGQLQYLFPNKQPLMNYFDFYDFGFRNVQASWSARTQTTRGWIDSHMAQLRGRIGLYLKKRSPYALFMMELAAHQPDDFDKRRALHDWYLETTLMAGYTWWEDFPVDSDRAWNDMKRYFGWLGVSAGKLGELLKHFFGEPETALKINEVLKESEEAFEHFFHKMRDFDKRFSGKTVSREFGEGMKLKADFARNVFVIEQAGKPMKEIGPVHFLVEVETVTEQVQVAVPPKKSGAMKRRFKKITRERQITSVFVPDVPFKTIHEWPLWLAALGDTLTLVVCLAKFGDDWKADKAAAVGKLAMNTFQAVGSVSSALYFTFRAGSKIPGLLTWTGNLGLAIEAYYNVKEGAIIVMEGDESAVTSALDRGDPVEATLQRIKGWVLIASAVPGTVVLVGAGVGAAVGGATAGGAVAAGASAAMAPLAIGLAAGALIVVGVEVAIYAHSGPDDAMDEVSKHLKKALKAEFGDVGEFHQSRTADDLLGLVSDTTLLFGRLEAR